MIEVKYSATVVVQKKISIAMIQFLSTLTKRHGTKRLYTDSGRAYETPVESSLRITNNIMHIKKRET